jgi:hypothetical protein
LQSTNAHIRVGCRFFISPGMAVARLPKSPSSDTGKRNLRRDSACQRREVKAAVPINGIGMSQAPRSRTPKPRRSSGVQSVASVLYRFLRFRPRRCSGLWPHATLFWSCGSPHVDGWNLFHCMGLCDCVHTCESGVFGTSSSQAGPLLGGLDLELCVSVLSQRWTVFVEIRGVSVFVRTFLAFGTSTASWPRNEKRHSKNMTVNARTKLST